MRQVVYDLVPATLGLVAAQIAHAEKMPSEVSWIQYVLVYKDQLSAIAAGAALRELVRQKTADRPAADQCDRLAGQRVHTAQIPRIKICFADWKPSVAGDGDGLRFPEKV